jgi:uncharacterized protein YsxB (DUF464 family)
MEDRTAMLWFWAQIGFKLMVQKKEKKKKEQIYTQIQSNGKNLTRIQPKFLYTDLTKLLKDYREYSRMEVKDCVRL